MSGDRSSVHFQRIITGENIHPENGWRLSMDWDPRLDSLDWILDWIKHEYQHFAFFAT